MAEDIYRMGLNGTIDPAVKPEMAETILQARQAIRERLRDPQLARVVELFDDAGYNESATVAENLLFGTPVGRTFSLESLADQPYVLEVLDKVGLTETFLEIGAKVAETMIELFADLPPGHEFFEQFSFISSDELPDFQPHGRPLSPRKAWAALKTGGPGAAAGLAVQTGAVAAPPWPGRGTAAAAHPGGAAGLRGGAAVRAQAGGRVLRCRQLQCRFNDPG